jgi:hypothetical protein
LFVFLEHDTGRTSANWEDSISAMLKAYLAEYLSMGPLCGSLFFQGKKNDIKVMETVFFSEKRCLNVASVFRKKKLTIRQ